MKLGALGELIDNPGLQHVAVLILKHMDFQSLAKCREVSRSFQVLIDGHLRDLQLLYVQQIKKAICVIKEHSHWKIAPNAYNESMVESRPLAKLAELKIVARLLTKYMLKNDFRNGALYFAITENDNDFIKLFIADSPYNVLANELMKGPNEPVPFRDILSAHSMPHMNWHMSVSFYYRTYLVFKLASAVYPSSLPQAMLDIRMRRFVAFLKEKENQMYNMANSRTEYYHLVAEKIYMLQKELEEKREKRRHQAGDQPGQAGAPGPAAAGAP